MINLDGITLEQQSAMLQNILLAFDGRTFSKELAMHIVGGEGKLNALISRERVEAVKPTQTQNGKWFVNASQVLMHCKNRRSQTA